LFLAAEKARATGTGLQSGPGVRRNKIAAAICIGAALVAISGCTRSPSEAEQEYAALDQSALADNAAQVVGCVEAKTGFVVHAGADGSISYTGDDVPDAQSPLVDQAIPECFQELGYVSGGELSEAQIEKLYDLELEAGKCLASNGYRIPDAPSKQTFVDNWGTPSLWAPWGEMGQYQLNEKQMQALQAKCPDPASFVR
jgi:hypothetical protein